MSRHKPGIVIVGAGECGVSAAFALRDEGYEGPITLVGDEAHLPYERPPLSKSYPVHAKPIHPAEAYTAQNITLEVGRKVMAIQPDARSIILDDNDQLSYSHLLLATGTRANVFIGMEKALTFRTLDDAQNILSALSMRKKLVAIGGGFIGLELAALATQLQADITILEAGDRLMARAVPASISQCIAKRHQHEGVKIHYGAQVNDITDTQVKCADGTAFDFDVVVAGTGSTPNVELAHDCGLKTDNGIVVDAHFKTSQERIFAAGDCCNFPYRGGRLRLESWRAAQEQGRYVAQSMLGSPQAYNEVPWLWSDQFDLSLQVAGVMPANAHSIVRKQPHHAGFIECFFAANGTLQAAAGVGEGNAIAKDIRLLEMLIARGAKPDPTELADPNTNLKTVLRQF